jgi:integrase/recombinase XerD
VELWLHGRPTHTQRAYRADVCRFLAFVDVPLAAVTVGDVQAFSNSLASLAPSSRSRKLAAVKSLFSFGHLGYLPFDVGRAVKQPRLKDTLAERILTEEDVVKLVALEPGRRNQVMLRLLYIAGLRVSEIADLKWRDLQPRTDGGQVTVFGKGSKTRVVLLPNPILRELLRFRQHAAQDAPVFPSRSGGGHLDPEHGRADRHQGRGARRRRGQGVSLLAPP